MKCTTVRANHIPFLRGECPAELARRMEEHLASCPACAREAEMLREVYRSLPELPVFPMPSDIAGMARQAMRAAPPRVSPFLRYWQPVTAAAAVLALVLGVGLFRGGWRHIPDQPAIVQQQPTYAPVAEPTELPASSKHTERDRTPHPTAQARKETATAVAQPMPAVRKNTRSGTMPPQTSSADTPLRHHVGLLAQHLLDDSPVLPSGEEIRCALLPLVADGEQLEMTTATLTVAMQEELAQQLPGMSLTRLAPSASPQLFGDTVTANHPEIARLAAASGCTYLVFGRVSVRQHHPLLELYLVNADTHTLLFDGRHPVRLTPDHLTDMARSGQMQQGTV